MGDKLTRKTMAKLDIFHKSTAREPDLPSLSSVLFTSNSLEISSLSHKQIESLKTNNGTQKKMDHDFSMSGMFSDGLSDSPNSLCNFSIHADSDKPDENSLSSVTKVAFPEYRKKRTTVKNNFLAETNESGNECRKWHAGREGDESTRKMKEKFKIHGGAGKKKTDLPSLSDVMSASNDLEKLTTSHKRIGESKHNFSSIHEGGNSMSAEQCMKKKKDVRKVDYDYSISEMFSGSDKSITNSSSSTANEALQIIREDFLAETSETEKERRKRDAGGNGDELPRKTKAKLKMLHRGAVKKTTDLPSLSDVMFVGNDSGKISPSHKRIEVLRPSIDSDKPVTNILPPVVNTVLPECSSYDAVDGTKFEIEITERRNKRKKRDATRNKLFKSEPKSPPKYLVDPKLKYRHNITTNYSKDGNLDLGDLFKDVENKSFVETEDTISTSSCHLSELFGELLTDPGTAASPLSNFSESSLTFRQDKFTSTIESENRYSPFATSQSMYLRRKISLLHKKRTEAKTMFNFKLCRSVTEEVSTLGSASRSSINLNKEYIPNSKSETLNNNKENQSRIILSPRQQNSSENFGKHFLKTDFVKSTESHAMKKCAKQRYPLDLNLSLYNTERHDSFDVGGNGKSVSIDGSPIAWTEPLITSLNQYHSPPWSTESNLTKSSSNCSQNNICIVAKTVQSFVKEWLEGLDRGNSETQRKCSASNRRPLKRRRLFSDSKNETEDSLVMENRKTDFDSEIFLSNHCSEYDEAYKDKRFEPK